MLEIVRWAENLASKDIGHWTQRVTEVKPST